MGANLLGQVATHQLAMVQVHLQQQVIAPDFVAHLMDVIGGIEKIPRHIAPIDGLDHELNAVWAYRLGGPAQIADEYAFTARQRGSGWGNASHGVEEGQARACAYVKACDWRRIVA
jgi:hypothetical protein